MNGEREFDSHIEREGDRNRQRKSQRGERAVIGTKVQREKLGKSIIFLLYVSPPPLSYTNFPYSPAPPPVRSLPAPPSVPSPPAPPSLFSYRSNLSPFYPSLSLSSPPPVALPCSFALPPSTCTIRESEEDKHTLVREIE